MKRALAWLFGLTLVSLMSFSGCSEDDAGLVVRIGEPVDSLSIDRIDVTVTASSKTLFAQSYVIPADAKLPGTLSFSAEGSVPAGSLSPGTIDISDWSSGVTFRVDARSGDQLRITRSAKIDHTPSRVRRMPLELTSDCVDVVCASGQTCDAGRCVSNSIDVDALVESPNAAP